METNSHSTEQSKKLGLIYFLVCLILGWSYLAWAYTGYSQGEPDALWFLPPAISYHNGEGLYNKLHEASQVFDSAHQQRFLFYTPGFQLILSSILPEPTGRGAFLALAFINFLSLILSALLFYRALKGRQLWLGVFGMLALSTYLGGFRLGRPDFLATFIVLLMTFAQMNLRSRAREILSAFLLGVLAFAHPVATLFASALLGIRYACDFSLPKTFLKMTVICSGGIFLFLLLMAMSPYGLKDGFGGIFLHAQNTMEHGTPHPFLKYWIMHSYATCYGILFIAAIGFTIWLLWNERRKIISKMGVIIFIIILTVFFYRFVAIAWDRCYNLWIFAPLMIAILLISARHCAESLRFAENDAATSLRVKGNSKLISSRQNFATIFISVILLLCSIGYFHSTALFGFYLKYGYQYEEARRDFQKFMSEHPHELIGVSKSLWILSEEYDRMKSFGMTPEHLWRKPNWIVLQQRFALKHSPEPPIFKNYELVSHNFSPYKATLLGLQLSPTMPGYFYAIYRAKKLK